MVQNSQSKAYKCLTTVCLLQFDEIDALSRLPVEEEMEIEDKVVKLQKSAIHNGYVVAALLKRAESILSKNHWCVAYLKMILGIFHIMQH